MFVNHRLAKIAAEKELQEAQARINVQQLLATAQAQAAQRALIVVREKAANEAKSEFMSVMCHEVRTPLNGCLASAEMLLETPLQVCLLPSSLCIALHLLLWHDRAVDDCSDWELCNDNCTDPWSCMVHVIALAACPALTDSWLITWCHAFPDTNAHDISQHPVKAIFHSTTPLAV